MAPFAVKCFVAVGALFLAFRHADSPLLKLLSLLESKRRKQTKQARPLRIILIRHGESKGNLDKQLFATVPDNRMQLSELGHLQAQQAGVKLQELIGPSAFVGFFVSPFQRTKQTLTNMLMALPDHQIGFIREDSRLREQEWGNFQDPAAFQSIFEDRARVGRFYYRFPTGESGADVYERVSGFLETLYRVLDVQWNAPRRVDTLVLVTHGLVMRFVLMRYFRWSVETFESVWNPENCEMWVLKKGENDRYYLSTEFGFPRSSLPISIAFRDGGLRQEEMQNFICLRKRSRGTLLQFMHLDDAEVEDVSVNGVICRSVDHTASLDVIPEALSDIIYPTLSASDLE
eukprot:NODE_2636_length_1130_cov_36.654038_g2514_i0.p1 GENE.NODE_2636_length_1130_cov_36.654038_g2514_i0~~NODE_2636_length_1130_cov_36.654038_g2514_i0.p1  ORF type:complete len:365 (+),score=103.57 NODE_2636_length_1130_cov_36.654038_g2514_i0:62-1096(+)